MRVQELRKKSDKELEKMLKDLKLTEMKASSVWGREKVERKEAGINVKGNAKQGTKTSLQKNIRRNIARIKTIMNERRLEQ